MVRGRYGFTGIGGCLFIFEGAGQFQLIIRTVAKTAGVNRLLKNGYCNSKVFAIK